MAKILIRAATLPYQSVSVEDMLKRDRSGTNTGNWIYQYSVIRTMLNEEDEFFIDNYSTSLQKADEINSNYDAYVIPLADAFREDFRGALRDYTKLVNRLKIPVYLIGAGLRAPLGANIQDGFSFDEDVRNFIAAILNKSGMVGLRGQMTADYLTSLGFKEGQDHMAIGCPSMYTFGRELKLKELQLNKRSLISINSTSVCDEESMNFLSNIGQEYKNNFFIPQNYPELNICYMGGPSMKHTVKNYPYDIESQFYKEGRVKFFLSAQTWFEYMRKVDFSIGTRLHGNIVATINGVPNITIVKDLRMMELAKYHNFPHIMYDQLKNFASLDDLISSLDINSAERVSSSNFDRFISFLDKNDIKHIYNKDIYRKDAPMDLRFRNLDLPDAIEPITVVSDVEKFSRMNIGLNIYKEKLEQQKRKAIKKITGK